jgi:polyisoprenoid-binding protein YceI
VIVPGQSRASYHADEEFFAGALSLIGIEAGKVRAVGSTQEIEGQLVLDPGRPVETLREATFRVRLDTLTSDRAQRDEFLREIRGDGPSFYAYPLAVFEAASAEGSATERGDLDVRLSGDLTIREVTKPVIFDVKARLEGDTLSGVGTTRLLLSDFGIPPIEFLNVLSVADEIGVEVGFTARSAAIPPRLRDPRRGENGQP